MNIVFTSLFTEDAIGGESRVAIELANAFVKIGHKVAVIRQGDKDSITEDNHGVINYTVSSLGTNEPYIPKLTSSSVKTIYEFLDEFHPDVIHYHSPLIWGTVIEKWANLKGIPTCCTLHVNPKTPFQYSQKQFYDRYKYMEGLFTKMIMIIVNSYNAVFAIDQKIQIELRELGYEGNIVNINNGLNLEVFDDIKIPSNKVEEINLIFIGHVCDRKNQLFLAKVLKHLPRNYKLLLIGSAEYEKGYTKEIKEYAKLNNLNIEFRGHLDYEQIPSELEKAHIFVSASKLETFSLVTLEAMAAGKPIVMLSEDAINNWLPEGVATVVDKQSTPEKFANAVKEIAEMNLGDYIQKCKDIKMHASQYDWRMIASYTENIYKKIIDEKDIADRYKLSKAGKIVYTTTLLSSNISYSASLIARTIRKNT